MTTLVLTEREVGNSHASMGFVLPEELAVGGVPEPMGEGVKIRKREGGRFAVMRFSGRLDPSVALGQEAKLRECTRTHGLEGESKSATAGYGPPFNPGLLRRNEDLIRLEHTATAETK